MEQLSPELVLVSPPEDAAAARTLLELGLVARNPGYGHPLRPEYVVTAEGLAVAERCAKLLATAEDAVVLRKWTLPVLVALDRAARFSQLRAELPGVTPRALALALKDLQAGGLVERRVEDAYPPIVVYRATSRAARAASRSWSSTSPAC